MLLEIMKKKNTCMEEHKISLLITGNGRVHYQSVVHPCESVSHDKIGESEDVNKGMSLLTITQVNPWLLALIKGGRDIISIL